MSDLPNPLTSADCDLRDFPFMPLDVVRLRDSDISALSSGDEFRCAVLLWCASWHQVPAASLPDDDKVLSQLAGFGRVVKEWLRMREGSLRGWVKCADGRLYHPVVAEKANEAWAGRIKYREKKEAERLRKAAEREAKRLAELAKELPYVPMDITDLSAGQSDVSDVNPPENALTVDSGQKTVDSGQWTVDISNQSSSSVHPDDDDFSTKQKLPPREAVELDHTPAVAMSVALRKVGVNVTSIHPTLLDWIAKGITIQLLLEAVTMARKYKPEPESIPPGYLNTTLVNMLNPKVGKGPAAPEPKNWWETATGIESQGISLGVLKNASEGFPDYKLRVFQAAGDGPWIEKSRGSSSTQGFTKASSSLTTQH